MSNKENYNIIGFFALVFRLMTARSHSLHLRRLLLLLSSLTRLNLYERLTLV